MQLFVYLIHIFYTCFIFFSSCTVCITDIHLNVYYNNYNYNNCLFLLRSGRDLPDASPWCGEDKVSRTFTWKPTHYLFCIALLKV